MANDESVLQILLRGQDRLTAITFISLGVFGAIISFVGGRLLGFSPFLLVVPYEIVVGVLWVLYIQEPYSDAKDTIERIE